MSALAAEFVNSYGGVQIEVTAMTAGGGGLIVKRAVPSSSADPGPWSLETIPGYDDATQWPGTGATTGLVYDLEMPLGVTVHYVLVPVAQTVADATTTPQAAVDTPGNAAWLRDVYSLTTSQPVWVVSTDPKNRVARQSVYNIAGKKTAVVVWDVRQARSGTITLFVQNQTYDLYRQTRREKMDALLDTGRPLLLSMCRSKGFDPCWMAIADARWTRWGSGPSWTLELDYSEVDNPIAMGFVAPTVTTYDMAAALPAAAATYNDWYYTGGTDTPGFQNYFDLAEGVLSP